jgi:isorenieratene synthase
VASIAGAISCWARPFTRCDVFLKYDAEATFDALDDQSYAQFAQEAALPSSLRLVFNTFARAFFAQKDRLSMAELVKSFHFFYLSHDHGLLYDYPMGHYANVVVAPLAKHLEALGVQVQLSRPVGGRAHRSAADPRGALQVSR